MTKTISHTEYNYFKFHNACPYCNERVIDDSIFFMPEGARWEFEKEIKPDVMFECPFCKVQIARSKVSGFELEEISPPTLSRIYFSTKGIKRFHWHGACGVCINKSFSICLRCKWYNTVSKDDLSTEVLKNELINARNEYESIKRRLDNIILKQIVGDIL